MGDHANPISAVKETEMTVVIQNFSTGKVKIWSNGVNLLDRKFAASWMNR